VQASRHHGFVEQVIGDDVVVEDERPQSECERDDGARDEVRGLPQSRRLVAESVGPHDHPRDPADAQLSGELMDQASERRNRAGSNDDLARGEQRGTPDRAEHDVPDRRGDCDPTSGAGQAPRPVVHRQPGEDDGDDDRVVPAEERVHPE
jgi:hypothetical protein